MTLTFPVRLRYWKLAANELDSFEYDPDKLINWDIKLVQEPEDDAIFVGIFMYRNGTPLDYEQVPGIAYYHNHIPRDALPDITKFLKNRFGGNVREKGERIFLEGSREIYLPGEIATLARDAEKKLRARATITLEFSGVTEDDMIKAGMPPAKLLPIPGVDV